MLWAASLHGAPQVHPEEPGTDLPPTTITDAGQFWTYRHYKPRERQALDLEFTVNYYDAAWNLLWGEKDGAAFFLPPTAGQSLLLKSGQRVRLTGSVVPEQGIAADSIQVAVLAENAWPLASATEGRLAQSEQWDARRVSVEGYVVNQSETDAKHVLFALLSEDRLVNARLQLAAGAPVPQLSGTRVRIKGVYVGTKSPAGALQRIDVWIARSEDIEVLGQLATDPRFERPPLPLAALAQAEPDTWVRLSGQVVARQPGRSLELRDDSGQLRLATPQPGNFAVGDAVEVIGQVTGAGWEVTLRNAVIRARGLSSEAKVGSARGPNRKLRLAAQVLELPPEEADQEIPAEISGVVTWAHGRAPFFFVEDASGGVRVRRQEGTRAVAVGEAVMVRGTTLRGAYAPELKLWELLPGTDLSVPPPRSVTLEQALTGAEESRWVQIRGYLREAVPDGDWTRLQLTTATGDFHAFAPRHADFATLQGSVVRIAGVCAAEANLRRELTDIRLWTPGLDALTVEVPPPRDPFAIPERSIASLRQYASRDFIDRRVRILGTVTRVAPGKSLHVQAGETGLLVLGTESEVVAVGDTVEVVGFPGQDGSRVVLRAASWRRASSPMSPPPSSFLADPAPVQPDVDARLVRMRGVLTDIARQGRETRFVLRAHGAYFEALLADESPGVAPPLGSVVELTGIYHAIFDEARRARRFELWLRSAPDLVVIERPSWWTPGRFGLAVAALALCSLGGAAWVALLRRRVAQQTELIRAQMANQARLQSELERSSRLESLGVLAGGIAHDFNNLLTAIIGNLGLISLEEEAMKIVGPYVREAQRAGKRASDVTHQLLTFAKGGDPIRQAVSLPEIVQEAATFALHGAKVGSEFSSAPDLPAALADAGQISRVVHNLVLNAVQAMSDGGVVKLALKPVEVAAGEIDGLAPGKYVQLSVADNGPGISAENLARIFEPYFSTKQRNSGLGLATVHSIIKKHQGHVAVESVVGHGTKFTVWLPAASEHPRRPVESAPAAAQRSSLRVLVMDDESIIRGLAGAFLTKLGHESVQVADGAHAVREYIQAQQQGRPFDLVILDLTVPGAMGGREAVSQLRHCDPDVRAVASSGYSSDPVMANFRDYGFTAILPKPYDLKALATVLERFGRA